MELEGEDGCIIFLERGNKKELGRGLGIAANDPSVSRRQVLLEVEDSFQNDKLNEIGHGTDILIVEVLGPNPVCIVQNRKNNSHSQEEETQPGKAQLVFLKKGERGHLSVGDKISLSITQPVFFTFKESFRHVKEEASRLIPKISGGYPVESPISKVAETSKLCNLSDSREAEMVEGDANDNDNDNDNNDEEEDLMSRWRTRKQMNEVVKKPDQQIHEDISKHGVSSIQDNDKVLGAKEEEEGIAEAVTRRQKRAAERRQQEQLQQQNKLLPDRRDLSDHFYTSGMIPDNNNVGSQLKLDHGFRDIQQIDPVTEFGFLLEGREFEQYGKHHRHGGNEWDWHIEKKTGEDKDEEQDDRQKVGKAKYHTLGRNKRKVNEDEDDEWMGEDEEEKSIIKKVRAPRTSTKLTLRSQDPSSSGSKRISVGVEGYLSNVRKTDDLPKNDEEDETLGGFIVNDDEDEMLDEELEEEEWADDNDNDNDNDNDEDEDGDETDGGVAKHNRGQKQVCRYGKDCYRKSKEHLEQYWHPC